MTRHLLATTPKSIPIVATTRASDPNETKESILSNLHLDHDASTRLDIQHCDLLSEPSISALSSHCKSHYNSNPKEQHLRLAVCLPGMLHPEKSPSQIDHDLALATLKLNLLSPMLLLKHFHTFLPKKSMHLQETPGVPDSAILSFLSARVGSITDNALGGWYSYRSSKAGLNQLVKTADHHQRITSAQNAALVGLHPGTVKTNLSKEFWANVKEEKLFSPEYSAEQLCRVLRRGGSGELGGGIEGFRGRCWDWKGEEVPP